MAHLLAAALPHEVALEPVAAGGALSVLGGREELQGEGEGREGQARLEHLLDGQRVDERVSAPRLGLIIGVAAVAVAPRGREKG